MDARPAPEIVEWAESAVGRNLVEAAGLRNGGTPWRLRFDGTDELSAILRISGSGEPGEILTEVRGLELARASGIPAPEVYAHRAHDAPALLLTEDVAGSSAIPLTADAGRLRSLGSIAARLHEIDAPVWAVERAHPIAGVDFDELRSSARPVAILERASERVRMSAVGLEPERIGFVHGDLWQGNLLWRDRELTAVIDWDCAGRGPAGIDLSAVRFDAALCFGTEAEHLVLDGWIAEAGREPANLAYWDLVAALASPPDMGWFVETIVDQGRPDLTRELLVERRREFLERALR